MVHENEVEHLKSGIAFVGNFSQLLQLWNLVKQELELHESL